MIRDNWRIILLVVFVLAAGIALFAPGLGGGAAANATGANATSGPTNLQYGLDLSGGTQIRAPLSGLTAENVDVGPRAEGNLTRQVASELNVSATDVQVRTGNGSATVEVYSENVSRGAFAGALQSSGYDVQQSDVRDGLTDQTYDTAVEVLSNKISESGLSGGTVQTVSAGGDRYVQIEIPNQNRSEVRELVADQGRVKTVAYFSVAGNRTPGYCEGPVGANGSANASGDGPSTCNVTVLPSQQSFQDVRPVQQDQRTGQPIVPVTLTEAAAGPFTQKMQRFGFDDPANSTCGYGQGGGGHCLLTVRDGEVVYSASVQPGLARQFASGEFTDDPAYQTSAQNVSEAQSLQVDLQAGALPAPLDLQEGTSQYILPSVAQRFKSLSLVTGLVAVLAVSVSIFVRYREPRVAVPMLLTGLAEVFILLGFASTIGLALDLSHIAGFIAVIGTGVDDLVIIADEILQSDVSTGKVFQSRFRRAFWVIGAAAATTIIAMSPLALLSLGDLRGFAIITIVGVLIGVLITRPAYGNVLRRLLTDN
ncbi:preprotein translocase subunit SecD [Halococcus sediminicola]|uniref:preprotein translocase subunit SecD n=1 Tax=Halococcus sediminicola TaxID=1264579 RepID=UPI000679C023|nr:preprotein translocase subunit SecD [Halococcus sediminicola]